MQCPGLGLIFHMLRYNWKTAHILDLCTPEHLWALAAYGPAGLDLFCTQLCSPMREARKTGAPPHLIDHYSRETPVLNTRDHRNPLQMKVSRQARKMNRGTTPYSKISSHPARLHSEQIIMVNIIRNHHRISTNRCQCWEYYRSGDVYLAGEWNDV